ncbi:MAG TPA: TetR/AcrR family transcriptional regulator [Candidatus Saccharimonadales bacterium]|jgi:TetR/AcrR family transcriptional repressor of nem operon|nr:TetR/AcrR family transcriptional regulator [Candidatus Saccharimonadales bacterium]
MGRTSDAKERLLCVAFDLIWTSSYGSVSVDTICERARVNKGSFYHFFPSKADLAVAAYEEFWQQKRPLYDRVFSPQVPPLERIAQWCELIYTGQKERADQCGRVLGCPYACLGAEMSTQDEKVRLKAEEVFARSCKYLESALADAKREKLVDIKDPKATAETIYAVVMGLLLQAKVRNDVEVLRDLQPTVMRLLGAKAVAT